MKPTTDQWDGISGEGHNWEWTPERQQEMSDHYERERMKIPYMSENAQDIENSKRSRGERL